MTASAVLHHLESRGSGRWSIEPTEHTGSPWSGDAQHGAPVSTLVVELAARELGDGPRLTRTTVELLRPVPRRRLEATVTPRREGRRLAVVDVELHDPERDVPVVLARSVWTAGGGIDVPTSPVDVAPWADLDEVDFIGERFHDVLPPGFHRSLRMRTALRPNPVIWLRSVLDGPTADRRFTSRDRFAGLADMATVAASRLRAASAGVSPAEADLGMQLVNADLTAHFSRAPEGEWVGFTDGRIQSSDGAGFASVLMLDDVGPVGRATHSVVASGR